MFFTLIFFLLTLALGAVLAFLGYRWWNGSFKQSEKIKQESTVLLEGIEKVFKVVMAEGHFTEIFDHKTEKEFLGIFKSNKKALIVSKAKVLVGYDFSKVTFKRDENNRKLVLEAFPEPEILSMDTDYKFYDVDQGWLTKFDQDDYTKILRDAKQNMHQKALESDLPKIAQRQLQTMMGQLAKNMNWQLDIKAEKTLPTSTTKAQEPKPDDVEQQGFIPYVEVQ